MSTTTLSQRLRDMRIGLFPDIETVNAVLDECIAKAEAMEARAGELSVERIMQAVKRAGSQMPYGHINYDMIRAELTKAGPVVTHLNMDPNASPETIEAVKDMVHAAYSYRPSQAIGEQTPVAYTMSRDYNALYERLKAGGEAFGYIDYNWHTGSIERVHAHISRNEKNGLAVNGKYKLHLTEGRTQADTVETCQRLNLEWVAPISSEARDMAIEALATVIELWRDELVNEGYDTSTNFDKATQALSALRGQ